MSRKAINDENAVSVGPYSHAVEANGFVFVSGQAGMDPAAKKLVQGGIREQTLQTFANLFAILKAAGATPDDVVKVNVFLTDMKDFGAMNEVYARQFTAPYPARSTVAVKELPLGALVEIEMIAQKGK